MAGTITIPLATLNPAHGPYTFGPAGVAAADSLIVLTIDRTVTNGFNSQPAATTAEITAEQSSDGGATWFLAVAGTVAGGQYFRAPPPRGDGSLITASSIQVNLYPGASRLVRAAIVVSGASVAVAGSLTVS